VSARWIRDPFELTINDGYGRSTRRRAQGSPGTTMACPGNQARDAQTTRYGRAPPHSFRAQNLIDSTAEKI
jgi:hypothetical protein